MTNRTGWHFWIDRGGTFTDIVGAAPDGTLHSTKLLSESPGHYQDAAAEGIRRTLAQHNADGRVANIRMGTTVATNALLEHTGARTGLLMTRGFGDALLIGDQDRPRLFDLHIRKPAPLYAAVAEIDERLAADGSVITPLTTNGLDDTLTSWRADGIEAVAICLLHAWLNPAHEQQLAAIVRDRGFTQIYSSHDVSPLMKLVGRAGTTVADAYLSPVLLRYVDKFRHELRNAGIACDRIEFMQSHGGLVSAAQFRGKDAILSGPAGGVVGMRAAGEHAGLDKLIGFDMGGTSTDVSVCAGEPDIVNDTEIGGVRLRTPMIRIHTIAAGGGSLLTFSGGRFQAGPASAGADPGPLSYGRGGPLALTDANVMLGRIQPDHFPRVFGQDGRQPLDTAAVRTAFRELATDVTATSGNRYTAEQTAEGFLRVAVENMANALRHISVARGLNPAEYTLCCFGGAGAQHACRVADKLGITRILLDPQAGVLSAWGMGAAPLRSYRQRSINTPLDATTLQATSALAETLATECRADLIAQGAAPAAIRTRLQLQLKAVNSDTTLSVDITNPERMRAAFAAAYAARFGFKPDTRQLQIDALRVAAEQPGGHPRAGLAQPAGATPAQAGTVEMYVHNAWQSVPVYERAHLPPGHAIAGPAIITEANSTTVLEPGWEALVNDGMQLLLTRANAAATEAPVTTAADPVMLEIINNRFVGVADEMGAVLRKTAQSVNIKERLDFSCALFTAQGDLIANAPHVPVHLGSMDDSVKSALRAARETLLSGGVILTNAPYNGGTHLPDVTAISPVFDTAGELCFVVASRAHHADIGGTTPGSMPPLSRHIDEEGVLFDHFPVVEDGEFREQELRALLAAGPWPARNPEQNVADFRAQIAANETGRRLLLGMLDHYGEAFVAAYASHVQANAEESVRQVIDQLGEGEFTYPLDNGQRICVKVSIDRAARSAVIDFSGTSAAAENNLNAPRAVCQAAVMYVFRTLVHADIPLNAGCRQPLQIIIPEGCMLNPRYPAAVVGGNVETSQCVTDALYGALGVLAGSQGTMNNLSFGNDRYQYYETIGGGAGAGPGFAGASAVQTHMTNTRITDTEVLESRYPVLVREFAVRRGSGGNGAWRGGDGVTRRIEFRAPMHAAVLSGHRKVAPFGIEGGEPGDIGHNTVERRDGAVETFGGTLVTDMEAGDILSIMTPGGGGAGTPPEHT